MMKRSLQYFIAVILVTVMLLNMFACSDSSGDTSSAADTSSEQETEISDVTSAEESSGVPEDAHWITVGDTEYGIPDENFNVDEITKDGIYVTNDGGRTVSPKSSIPRRDIVVMSGKIVYAPEEGINAIMPNCGGVIITFAGTYSDVPSSLSEGDTVKTRELDTESYGGYHVTIDGVIYPIDIVNGIRTPEGVTAIYTSEYGNTTGTNQYGIEIAVSDGKVTATETGTGNMVIPENGYVLSIHKDAVKYSRSRRIKKGEEASLFLGVPNYYCDTLKITGTNTTRTENALILYKDRSSTQTNPYGFEIAVDENGYMVSSGHAGNIAVPKNGFVLSGHGTNEKLLESCYIEGGRAKLLDNGKVLVHYAPDTILISELNRFERLEEEYLALRSSLVPVSDEEYEAAKNAVSETKRLWENGDMGSAGERFEDDGNLLTELEISLIRFPVIENRGTWYRSREKSDDEVRKVVSDMASMGINTLYLETWYNGSFIGFSDNELIIHSKANGDYDALEAFTRIGHEYGISVHAWVENFFIGTVENQEQANMKLAEHFDGRWLKDKTGKNTFYYSVSNTNFIFMNPFDDEVRSFLVDFYDEILTKYDVDGIHLDYTRFPELNYGVSDFGYNDDIVKAWQEKEGTKQDPKSLVSGTLYSSWISFRKEIITSFVGEIASMMDEKHPDAWLSAAVYPEPASTSSQLFQDPYEWVKRGYTDELVSMTYTGDNSYVRRNASAFAREVKDKCFYSTGLSAFSDTPWDTLIYQPGEARNASADGFSVFSFAYFDISSNLLARTLSRSRSVRVDDACGMISAVYGYYEDAIEVFVSESALDKTNAGKLTQYLNAWKKKCESLDVKSSGYLSELRDATMTLKDDISSLFADKTNAVNAVQQIERMIHCLDILITRKAG